MPCSHSRRALEIRESLASADPADKQLQANLANAINDIGTMHGFAGDLAKSLELHHRAAGIRQRLVTDNPSITEYQTELATSRSNIGFLLGRKGELENALEAYESALEIQERLIVANPRTSSSRPICPGATTTSALCSNAMDSLRRPWNPTVVPRSSETG